MVDQNTHQLLIVKQELLLLVGKNLMDHYLKITKQIGVELCIHQLDKKHFFYKYTRTLRRL